MIAVPNHAPVIHVRLDGRSHDVSLSQLHLGINPSDEEIRRAIAVQLEVPVGKLGDTMVDRHPNGNLTIRPQAVFG